MKYLLLDIKIFELPVCDDGLLIFVFLFCFWLFFGVLTYRIVNTCPKKIYKKTAGQAFHPGDYYISVSC